MFQNLKEPSWPSEWKERWLTQEGSKIRREGGYLTRYSKIRGRWLPHKILKDQGKVAIYLSRYSQIREGGYLTRYSQIRAGWLPHKVLTDKGRVATPQDTHR